MGESQRSSPGCLRLLLVAVTAVVVVLGLLRLAVPPGSEDEKREIGLAGYILRGFVDWHYANYGFLPRDLGALPRAMETFATAESDEFRKRSQPRLLDVVIDRNGYSAVVVFASGRRYHGTRSMDRIRHGAEYYRQHGH